MKPFQEKIIGDKLQEHASFVDTDALWSGVNDALKERRRFGVLILLFWLSPLLVLLGWAFDQGPAPSGALQNQPVFQEIADSENNTIESSAETEAITSSFAAKNKTQSISNKIIHEENIMNATGALGFASSNKKNNRHRLNKIEKLPSKTFPTLISSKPQIYSSLKLDALKKLNPYTQLIEQKHNHDHLPAISIKKTPQALRLALGLTTGAGVESNYFSTQSPYFIHEWNLNLYAIQQNNWYFRTGLNHQKHQQSFEYSGQYTQWDSTLAPSSIYIQSNGDTIIDRALVAQQKTIATNIKARNEHTYFGIPLLAGKQFHNKRFTVGLDAGIQLNIKQQFKGIVINTEGVPNNIEAKNNTIKLHYLGNVYGQYQLNRWLAIKAEARYRLFDHVDISNHIFSINTGINLKLF